MTNTKLSDVKFKNEGRDNNDVDVDTVEDDFVDKLQVLLLISPGAKDNDVAVPSNDMPCEPVNADPVVPVSCDRDAEERGRVLADDVENNSTDVSRKSRHLILINSYL